MTTRLSGRMTSIMGLGIRGAGLVMRFALSFYIIKFLGLKAAGIYGLSLGAIGLAPAILGFGLNYFLARDIVGVDKAVSGIHVKTREAVTTGALSVATLIVVLVSLGLGHGIATINILIAVLVWLETYAADLHVSLIAVELPAQANLLVFVRMALWVPVVVGLGLLVPALRSMEVIFLGWIGSYTVYVALFLWFVRTWPIRQLARAPIDVGWIKERAGTSWFIYLSDLGMVGSMYVDRYVVSFLLGLKQTGLYTFYWSLTNALQTLVGTAVVQLALPALYKAFRQDSVAGWRLEMRAQIARVLGFAAGLAALIYGASLVLFRFMSMPQVAEHSGVFLMLLVATVIRSLSDLFNIALMSAHKDRQYGFINMAGVILSATMTLVMIRLFGFAGAGVGALVTAVTLAGSRGIILWRFARTDGVAA